MARFKTYVCNEYPFLKLSTSLKDQHGSHITIAFGEGPKGLYTAKSHEEEAFIEGRSWFGVKIFPFDQGEAVADLEETGTGDDGGDDPGAAGDGKKKPRQPKHK